MKCVHSGNTFARVSDGHARFLTKLAQGWSYTTHGRMRAAEKSAHANARSAAVGRGPKRAAAAKYLPRVERVRTRPAAQPREGIFARTMAALAGIWFAPRKKTKA